MKLTDPIIKTLPLPARGNKIHWDDQVRGFGVRVTAAGAKSYILSYCTRAGRERRFTIGRHPDWKVTAARTEAAEWKRRVRSGEDPLADLEAERMAPTVADLCERFEAEHLPKKRASTQRDYRQQISKDILPTLRNHRVADLTFSDVDRLHRTISKRAPIHANRVVAMLSKMLSLAIKWGWCTDNPAKGIERNHEEKRERYLSGHELARLAAALAEHEDQQAANIFRLLLLTGARKGEVLTARWSQFDLQAGVWSKPASGTKQRKPHVVPLSAPARQLLRGLWESGDSAVTYVFPARRGGKEYRVAVNDNWRRICVTAGITDCRIHDMRHSFASILASSGMSLPIIGRMLGHSSPTTTARYSHLHDDPLRIAAERVGAVVSPPSDGPQGGIVPLSKSREH